MGFPHIPHAIHTEPRIDRSYTGNSFHQTAFVSYHGLREIGIDALDKLEKLVYLESEKVANRDLRSPARNIYYRNSNTIHMVADLWCDGRPVLFV